MSLQKSQLPPNPHIDSLRKQARQLLRDYESGAADATAAVKDALSGLPPSAASDFTLRHAQQVIAHNYGFTSWQALADQVRADMGADAEPTGARSPAHYQQLAERLADAFIAGETASFGLLATRLSEQVITGATRDQIAGIAHTVIASENGCSSVEALNEAAVTAEPIVTDGEQLRLFEESHAPFASHLARRLTAAGAEEVSVQKAFTDQTTFGEYLLSVTNNNIFQMTADFLEGDFAANAPRQLLLATVDDPEMATDQWGGLFSEALMDTWRTDTGLPVDGVSVRDCHREPFGAMQFTPMYEVCLLFAYEAHIGTGEDAVKGIVEVCYPRSSILSHVRATLDESAG